MPRLQRRSLGERTSLADPLAFLRASFARFLQVDVQPDQREETGLQRVLRSTFPITSASGDASLEFVSYATERPRYGVDDCLRRGMTYASPLKCVVRLIIWETGDDGQRIIRDVKEQEVYFGEAPLLTERGTLIADGREVVLVPSLRPRPGLELRPGAVGADARLHDLYGNALSLTREASGALTVGLELAEGTPASALLRARPGVHTLAIADDGLQLTLSRLPARKLVARQDLLDGSGRVVVRAGKGVTPAAYAKLREQGPLTLSLTPRDASALRLTGPAHGADGQVVAPAGASLRQATLRALTESGLRSLQVEFDDEKPEVPEPTRCESEEALGQWLDAHLDGFVVGPDAQLGPTLGLADDTCSSGGVVYGPHLQLIAARLREVHAAPASHLRIWAAGEALEQAAWIGCRLMAAEIGERLSSHGGDVDTLMPHDLLNARPVARSFRFLLETKSRTVPADDLQPLALLEQLRTLELRGVEAPTGWPRSEHGLRLPLEVEPDAAGAVVSERSGSATPIAGALVPLGAGRAGELLSQCLPPAETEPPRVATGAEEAIARATGELLCAHADGEVVPLGPELWAVFPSALAEVGAHAVPAPNSNRGIASPARTWPAEGRRVAKGEVLAGSPGTSGAELALGHNLRVAFAPGLQGIVLSASVVEAGQFATLRLRQLECVARDTRLGKEEITADIPGLVAPLIDESGVARLGAEVKPGEVLVGKATPLEQPHLSPEETLLSAITGKFGPVADSSLRAGPDDAGVVRYVDIFARPGSERSARHTAMVEARLQAWKELERQAQERSWRALRSTILTRWGGTALASKLYSDSGQVLAQAGETLDESLLRRVPDNLLYSLPLGADAESELSRLVGEREVAFEALLARAEDEAFQRRRGEELPPGVISVVRVSLESRQVLGVGDRLADRHGFSARIERIASEVEMPRLPDGRAIEALLPWPEGGPTPGALTELRLGAAAEAQGLWLEVPARPTLSEQAIRDFCGDAPHAELPTGLLYLVRLPPS